MLKKNTKRVKRYTNMPVQEENIVYPPDNWNPTTPQPTINTTSPTTERNLP
jgi:hypothetical protein